MRRVESNCVSAIRSKAKNRKREIYKGPIHQRGGGQQAHFFPNNLVLVLKGKMEWKTMNGDENDETAFNEIKALQITKMLWLTSEGLGR